MGLTKDEILERCFLGGDDRVVFDRVLNLTDGGEAVEADDPRGEFRLVGAGGSLPGSLVRELGLHPDLKAHQAQVDAEAEAQRLADEKAKAEADAAQAEAERVKAEAEAADVAAKEAEAANAAKPTK